MLFGMAWYGMKPMVEDRYDEYLQEEQRHHRASLVTQTRLPTCLKQLTVLASPMINTDRTPVKAILDQKLQNVQTWDLVIAVAQTDSWTCDSSKDEDNHEVGDQSNPLPLYTCH